MSVHDIHSRDIVLYGGNTGKQGAIIIVITYLSPHSGHEVCALQHVCVQVYYVSSDRLTGFHCRLWTVGPDTVYYYYGCHAQNPPPSVCDEDVDVSKPTEIRRRFPTTGFSYKCQYNCTIRKLENFTSL